MCDYSLQAVSSIPAKVGEKLVTHNFGTGTTGFKSAEPDGNDAAAVCVLPGTELAFDEPIRTFGTTRDQKTARFRQINRDQQRMHHDALELPDGQVAMLTHLDVGQRATVLQLPAEPKNEAEREEQRRVEYAG